MNTLMQAIRNYYANQPPDPEKHPFWVFLSASIVYDADTDGIYICDDNGMIVTRQDWQELSQAVERYFASAPTDDELAAHNLVIWRRSHEYQKPPRRQRGQAKPLAPQCPGYIYLIKGDAGLYKVGKSKHPDARHYSLVSTMPFPVEIVSSYKVPDMKPAELSWHTRFASKRVNGEWFRLTAEDVQAFIATAQEQPLEQR